MQTPSECAAEVIKIGKATGRIQQLITDATEFQRLGKQAEYEAALTELNQRMTDWRAKLAKKAKP